MVKRLILLLALIVVIAPFSVSAVTVTTDLQGELIKASQPTVYFYGEDGKRYVFPNEKIFYTWYSDFSSVRTVTDEELADIQIGGNVTYRPGTKLVKVTTDPRVYAVSGHGRLRWIMSEELALSLYGEDWSKQVHDVPDAFFQDYEIFDPITEAAAYEPDEERKAYDKISYVVEDESSSESDTDNGNRVITLSSDGGRHVSWTDSGSSPHGYKLVWSKNSNPTYPTRSGDSYRYYDGSSSDSGYISGTLKDGVTYYVRVCEYLGGKCGVYSNQITIEGTDATDDADKDDDEKDKDDDDVVSSGDHTIILSSEGGKDVSWTDTAVSPLGYKLVWSKNSNPTYPTRSGDSYRYYGGSNSKSGSLSGTLKDGVTYYVRVCEYLGGKCGAYSNQITIVGTEGATEDKDKPTDEDETSSGEDHAIVLSSEGGDDVSWTDTAESPKGYKLVWSENSNPTYPTRSGDSYHYYSDSDARSGSIDTDPGVTYYVRVCEYLGGKCGAYSNEITVTAE